MPLMIIFTFRTGFQVKIILFLAVIQSSQFGMLVWSHMEAGG